MSCCDRIAFHRGTPPVPPEPPPPFTPSFITSVPAILSVHAATDVVLDDDTNGVTAWLDRTANFRNYTQFGADDVLPLWSAAGGPGGRPDISGDGIARFLPNVNWNPPAPAPGTPLYWRMIARLNAWGASNRHLWGGATASRLALRTVTASPQVALFNVTQGPSAIMTVGTWFLVEAFYNGAVSDFLKIGAAAEVTGVNVGSNDQAAHALFGLTTGVSANCTDLSIAKLDIFAGLPTLLERAMANVSDFNYYNGVPVM